MLLILTYSLASATYLNVADDGADNRTINGTVTTFAENSSLTSGGWIFTSGSTTATTRYVQDITGIINDAGDKKMYVNCDLTASHYGGFYYPLQYPCDNCSLTGWFYDDGDTTGYSAFGVNHLISGNGDVRLVYNPLLSSNYYSVYSNTPVYQAHTVTTVPVAVGWHNFTFDFLGWNGTNNTLRLWIDDVAVKNISYAYNLSDIIGTSQDILTNCKDIIVDNISVIVYQDIVSQNYTNYTKYYENRILEGTYTNFTLAFENEFYLTKGNLVYNNTGYPSTETILSNKTYLINNGDVLTPLIDVPGLTKVFYYHYNITLPNQTLLQLTSTSNNQEVIKLNLNSTCTPYKPLLNISFYDEDSLTNITPNTDILAEAYYNPHHSAWISLNDSFNITQHNITLCDNYNKTEFLFDISIYPTLGDYYPKTFKFFDTLTTAKTYNLPIYMSSNGNQTQVLFTLYDENSKKISGYILNIERYYPATNEFKLIDSQKSDNNGEVLSYLVLYTTEYRFKVYDDLGNLVKTINKETIKSSTVSINVPTLADYFAGIDAANNAVTTLTFNNNSKTITWVTESSYYDQSCLLVQRLTGGQVVLYDNCNEGSYVVDSYTILENTTDKLYEFKGYFKDSDGNIVSGEMITYFNSIGYQAWGTSGLLLSIFVIIILFFLGIWNPAVGIFFTLLGIMVLSYLQVINLLVSTVIGIILAGGFVLYKLKT